MCQMGMMKKNPLGRPKEKKSNTDRGTQDNAFGKRSTR